MKQQKTKYIITAVILIFISFYAGMSYGKGKATSATTFGQGGSQVRTARTGGTRGAGGFITGDILSQDANSITVKLSDGGSKIIFLSASTTVSKSTVGSISDLSVGTGVMVSGKTNPDGSVTAQMIQLRGGNQMMRQGGTN